MKPVFILTIVPLSSMTPASITISKPAQPLKPIVPSILMAKPSRMSRWMSPPLRIRTIRASKGLQP